MSELYLVRHAQASFATEDYDRLSAIGFKQATYLGEYFCDKGIHFDRVICGDMQRHKQTLESMSKAMNDDSILKYQIGRGFNEYDFSALVEVFGREYPTDELFLACSWEKGDKKLFFQLLRRVLKAWQREEISGTPESWEEYQCRINKELKDLKQSSTSGSKVLVMSSGGPIGVFVGLSLEASADKMIELNLQMRNTGVSHFFYNKDKMNLHEFNAIPHLQNPQQAEYVTYG